MPAAESWRAIPIMKILFAAALLALALTAQAQQQPSSKVTAKTANLTLIPKSNGNGQWQTILSNRLKTSNQKDVLIGVSAEIGLFVKTTVNSKNMVEDTATGQAEVEFQVLLDGKSVEPGIVVFGRKTQVLSATLEGSIGNCIRTSTNLDGTISSVVDLTCVTPENISLISDSLQATTFNFISVDCPQGTHVISVQARVSTIGSSTFGSFSALAFVGKASFFAESIRLTKSPDVILELP
jgi:hypothetical protein